MCRKINEVYKGIKKYKNIYIYIYIYYICKKSCKRDKIIIFFKMNESGKERTVSTASSASSVTEYVNEVFEESELELSKVVSIQVSNGSADQEPRHLQDFVNTTESRDFIPRGFRKMYLAALVVLLFPICMGVTGTYSATATEDMKKSHSSIHPSQDEVSWIGSLMPIGALIGGTAGGYFTNSLGRKGSLMFNVLPFVSGWVLIMYAESTSMIYVGRILTGFATGIVSVTTPMYLVEISTPEIRGLLGASFQLFVVVGILIVSSLGAALTWRWLAVSGAVTCILAVFLMLPIPESPRWLMSKNRREEAEKALIYLQGESFDADAECQAIEDEIKSQPAGHIQLIEFKAPTVYKPFILSILLMFFQQFSGVNAVLFYTVDIFKGAHVSLDPTVATIIVSLIQVLATLLSSVLMDRAGRRPLLLISAACMAVSLFVFGGYDFAKSKNFEVVDKYGWLPVICLTAFIAAFSIGFGPTPWLMVAEMTPARFRSVVSGIATALNWTFAFIITYTFKKLQDGIKGYGVYWLYGTFCLISIIMTFFFLPETKGKKAEEIEKHFTKK